MGFEPGRTVVRRYFKRGQMLSVVKTGTVVHDDERGLLLWIPGGSPLAWLRLADGRGLHDVPFPEWVAAPKKLHRLTWQGYGILVLVPPGAAHSVWWFWADDVASGEAGGVAFDRWYINLELPSVRWDDGDLAGVDTVDHDLDVVAWPDGAWEFKDEHELIERLAYPEHYWVSDEAAVREEAARGDRGIRGRDVPVRRQLVRLPAAGVDHARSAAGGLGPPPGLGLWVSGGWRAGQRPVRFVASRERLAQWQAESVRVRRPLPGRGQSFEHRCHSPTWLPVRSPQHAPAGSR